jgi:hypothetical protein
MKSKEINLMYVESARGNRLSLSGVGSSVGVTIPVNLPAVLMYQLVGRHVWINGGWGDICTIHSWPDLPKLPKEYDNGN